MLSEGATLVTILPCKVMGKAGGGGKGEGRGGGLNERAVKLAVDSQSA